MAQDSVNKVCVMITNLQVIIKINRIALISRFDLISRQFSIYDAIYQ
ncbi:hypothetical protein AO375_1866 [Moraxella catarrhalis]|nr:hypothetical protein AO375_1866 [Moraxella catarrhalis]